MEIITIETSALGDRSYVLVDGDVAAVIGAAGRRGKSAVDGGPADING